MSSHVEIDIACPAFLFDTLTGVLAFEGFEGFWEDGDMLRCYIPSGMWNPSRMESLRERVTSIARTQGMPPPRITVEQVADRNWNAEWEGTIRPIRATDRIVIAPTWHPYSPGPDDLVITIDPKMSFGTGYHETTRLMLRLLEEFIAPGISMADVGTGTGILAIAALRLGAASATGVDIDPWSFDNAVENVNVNGLEGKIRILQGGHDALPDASYDLIAANIQKNVIEGMLPELVKRLVPGGRLLLSGLLLSDRDALLSSLTAAGLTLRKEITEHEWIAFACARA